MRVVQSWSEMAAEEQAGGGEGVGVMDVDLDTAMLHVAAVFGSLGPRFYGAGPR